MGSRLGYPWLFTPTPGFNEEVSGAQIVFGIARRFPPPNTPKQPSNTKNMSGFAKKVPHTTAENIIVHESNLLTTFCSVTPRHHPVIISNRFSACRFIFQDVVLLARLVKAEIMSPYYGTLINTSVGNPTVPSARPLGNRRVLRRVGRRLIFAAFIRG